MCVFNDLSGGDKYPSLIIHYTDGRERIIKNVSYFSIWEDVPTHENTVRVFVGKKDKLIICKKVEFVMQTYYNYKKVDGRLVVSY